MGDKGRRSSGQERRVRQKSIAAHVRKSVRFIVTHRQAFLAGGLVVLLVVLLFGVFSYFQPPAAGSAASSETTIDYSVLVAQVKSGNMLAVTIRGTDLHGLLVRPLAQA